MNIIDEDDSISICPLRYLTEKYTCVTSITMQNRISIYLDSTTIKEVSEFIAEESRRCGMHVPRSIVFRKLIKLGMAAVRAKAMDCDQANLEES